MRLQIGKSQVWLVLIVCLVGLIILLSHITTNLTPDQASWIIAQLPGASDPFDKTITLSNGYKLSTSSSTPLFKLLPRSAKRVQSDLAAFDVFLSSQEFHYPEGLDFYPENKPRQIVISLASMPQRYFVLVDPQRNKEVGSVGITSSAEQVTLNIYLSPQNPAEITSQLTTKLALYGFYALTHGWPTDPAPVISQINQKYVDYYGHQGNKPTFYAQ